MHAGNQNCCKNDVAPIPNAPSAAWCRKTGAARRPAPPARAARPAPPAARLRIPLLLWPTREGSLPASAWAPSPGTAGRASARRSRRVWKGMAAATRVGAGTAAGATPRPPAGRQAALPCKHNYAHHHSPRLTSTKSGSAAANGPAAATSRSRSRAGAAMAASIAAALMLWSSGCWSSACRDVRCCCCCCDVRCCCCCCCDVRCCCCCCSAVCAAPCAAANSGHSPSAAASSTACRLPGSRAVAAAAAWLTGPPGAAATFQPTCRCTAPCRRRCSSCSSSCRSAGGCCSWPEGSYRSASSKPLSCALQRENMQACHHQ